METIEKKALWVIFRPKDPANIEKMRELFLGSYLHFKEMSSLYAKTWWVNEKKMNGEQCIYLTLKKSWMIILHRTDGKIKFLKNMDVSLKLKPFSI